MTALIATLGSIRGVRTDRRAAQRDCTMMALVGRFMIWSHRKAR